VNDELNGKDFIALRRLSDADDVTIADIGATCERVPAAASGGTVSEALARLLASGKIAHVIDRRATPPQLRAELPLAEPPVPAVDAAVEVVPLTMPATTSEGAV
jgi:hypothetical protein